MCPHKHLASCDKLAFLYIKENYFLHVNNMFDMGY